MKIKLRLILMIGITLCLYYGCLTPESLEIDPILDGITECRYAPFLPGANYDYEYSITNGFGNPLIWRQFSSKIGEKQRIGGTTYAPIINYRNLGDTAYFNCDDGWYKLFYKEGAYSNKPDTLLLFNEYNLEDSIGQQTFRFTQDGYNRIEWWEFRYAEKIDIYESGANSYRDVIRVVFSRIHYREGDRDALGYTTSFLFAAGIGLIEYCMQGTRNCSMRLVSYDIPFEED